MQDKTQKMPICFREKPHEYISSKAGSRIKQSFLGKLLPRFDRTAFFAYNENIRIREVGI